MTIENFNSQLKFDYLTIFKFLFEISTETQLDVLYVLSHLTFRQLVLSHFAGK